MSAARGAALALLLALPGTVDAQSDGGSAVGAYLVVLSARLNVRERPGLDAKVLDTAARGDVLCVLGYEGDWARVRRPSSIPEGEGPVAVGWVSRGFVSETRAPDRRLDEMGCGTPGSLPRAPSRDSARAAGRSPSESRR